MAETRSVPNEGEPLMQIFWNVCERAILSAQHTVGYSELLSSALVSNRQKRE